MARTDDYALIQKILHWLIAICVAGMIGGGLYMSSIGFDPNLPQETQDMRNFMYSMHKSTGVALLALMAIRLLARLALGAPRLPDSIPGLQRFAAGAAQLALYFLLFAMPLIGWMATSAGGFLEPVYGLFQVPPLLPSMLNPLIELLGIEPITNDKALTQTLFSLHWTIGVAIVAVLVAHIGGAMLHLLILRDGVFKRMWF